MRLDSYLVECGLVESRNKAQQLIKDNAVSVDGKIIDKVSYETDSTMKVEIADVALYVSRAAIKLKGFLPFTLWDLNGLNALDVGSSTGGFTQILLENNVSRVTCVDVGSEQLHPSLRSDSRVSIYENTDIRAFKSEKPFDIIVCDVAFIPLELILESIDTLASNYIILLFKPQFQVGREVKRDKNGVVKDNSAVGKAMIRFEDTCALLGWKMIAKETAQIAGKEGNQETCYGFIKG
jgi:23S rRNA (cytidine1920-2'-O)/16S rRNA (cytidine1409-2'-O)-methyltransferase